MQTADTTNPAYRHGHAPRSKFSPTYQSWACMVQRVTNPRRKHFDFYNPLGMEADWREFDAFLADMGELPNGTSLDRIDNARGYFRDNCRWATRLQQANNTRSNLLVRIGDREQSITQWCRDLGISHNTVRARMRKHGFSPVDALTRPKQDRVAAAIAMTKRRVGKD